MWCQGLATTYIQYARKSYSIPKWKAGGDGEREINSRVGEDKGYISISICDGLSVGRHWWLSIYKNPASDGLVVRQRRIMHM